MKKIYTENSPKPGGHYSQATVHNGTIYVSGQLPIHHDSGEKELGSLKAQTALVLKNTEAILDAAGSSKDKILKVNIYISDVEYWGEINTIYAEFFGEHKPARAVIPVNGLHFGFKLEIDAIAEV